ncbi:MAG: TetR/AcrR family transcriptional regulator C-terminal ligand-binding domain-containing protein [Actinomycetota bacterium]
MNATDKRVGRPPGPHGDTLGKLLPTALRLFIEEGGAALTPTRLHQETGVGRATIYRNWPEPADLIEVMLGYATEQPDDDRFTGDLRADLHLALDELLDRFDHKPARAFFAACMEYGRHSARVASAAEAFIDGILGPFRLVLAAAVEAGELDGPVDALVSEVTGPLVLEHVVMGRHVSRARGAEVVDTFLAHRLDGPAG